MIAIVDYGAGNLRSVCNAFERFGQAYKIAKTPEDLDGATGILLPGVGHFGAMTESLEASGISARLRAIGREGTPILGICLGMQAMFESSEEAIGAKGLGFFPGEVKRFVDVPRVPHMGWNDVTWRDREPEGYYFANSFFAPIGEWTTGVCGYGSGFSAAVERENISGVQFHPEKSGDAGIKFLAEWCQKC
jgi:imidazole glycerol phosphate synthase glutamine amidotransferase subunit